MKVAVLRLSAPLMGFGDVVIDNIGSTDRLPGLSMLTGLLANALGYDRTEFAQLQSLQERILFAARLDREGVLLDDYQTVDLGQPFMLSTWTTSGVRAGRAGGPASKGTHIRYRPYRADSLVTVVIHLRPDEKGPTLQEVAVALRHPHRPLFLGRKPCIPSRPIFEKFIEAETLLGALKAIPVLVDEGAGRVADTNELFCRWPAFETENEGRLIECADQRDWQAQLHVGQRPMREGTLLFQEDA